MRDLHIGGRLVSDKSAQHYINVFGWLVENFPAQFRFPNGQFYKYSEAEILSSLPPTPKSETSQWITDRFIGLKGFCNMGSWPISFKPRPETMPQNDKTKTQKHSLFEVYSSKTDEKYYIDEFGRPIFYYDPKLVMQPGYIKTRIITKLSDMLHKTALKPEYIQATPNIDLTIMCGAYIGFGHVFCAGQKPSKKFLKRDFEDNIPAFSLCLFFQILGLDLAGVKKDYGEYLSDTTKDNLRIGYKQLKSFSNEIKELRTLLEVTKQKARGS